MTASSWNPGDPCRLVDLREGKVYDDAVIEVVKGHKMVVAARGKRWSADIDSSFVQRRPAGDNAFRAKGPDVSRGASK